MPCLWLLSQHEHDAEKRREFQMWLKGSRDRDDAGSGIVVVSLARQDRLHGAHGAGCAPKSLPDNHRREPDIQGCRAGIRHQHELPVRLSNATGLMVPLEEVAATRTTPRRMYFMYWRRYQVLGSRVIAPVEGDT